MEEIMAIKPETTHSIGEQLVKVVVSTAAGFLTSKLVEKGMDAYFEYRHNKVVTTQK